MLEPISALLSSLTPQNTKGKTTAAFCCKDCYNTPRSLSQNDFRTVQRSGRNRKRQPLLTRCQRIQWRRRHENNQQLQTLNLTRALQTATPVPPGQGLLPQASQFAPLIGLPAQFIMTVMQLFLPSFNGQRAGVARHNPAPGALATIDAAVNQVVNGFLPWNPAAALQQQSAASPSVSATAGKVCWRIHSRRDNATLLRQQVDEFLQQMRWQPDQPLRQQLIAKLSEQDVIFIYPEPQDRHRPQRAHEEEMRRRTRQYEMEIQDKTLATTGIGAQIIAWADEQTDNGHTLFIKGVESYNPLYFLASGGEILLGYFSRAVGEVYAGTILDRLPGESRADWLTRLMFNLLMPSEQTAAKAFGARPFRPVKPVSFRPINAVSQLPGTAITHPPTGITLHSVLQAEIAGQRWQLYPLGESHAMAVLRDASPAVSRAATRGQHNRWHIDGLAGAHPFRHGKNVEWLIRDGELFYPAKYSARDGSVELPDGQTIYFSEVNGQWQALYSGNPHLDARAAAILPQGVSSSEPGAQSVLVSIGHQQCEVWSAANGVDYLTVREQVAGRSTAETFYVAGKLEGDFFTIRQQTRQRSYQQRVLKWQQRVRQWTRGESPWRLLQQAEEHIDLSWLQPISVPQGGQVMVHNRPGLYRRGKELFLRWQTDETGADGYLPLTATADAAEYRTLQPGAESENHFRYDETAMQWQFLRLTSEAFFGLPQAVKVRHPPAFMAAPESVRSRLVSFSGEATYILIGADTQGHAEYIQVEQDTEDYNLFSLRLSQDNQPDTLWVFRYDEDNEFVLEEQRRCLPRIKRSDEPEPCAGPSGLQPPLYREAPPPAKKRMQTQPEMDPKVRLWLESFARSPQEVVQGADTPAVRNRKNLTYALRLNMWAPKAIPLSSIARHAGLATRRFNFILGSLSPEGAYCLVSHPPKAGEDDLAYALRLLQLYGEFDNAVIANFIGIKESELLSRWHKPSAARLRWLERCPPYPEESKIQYAVRLANMPEGKNRLKIIAAHSGVSELSLRLSVSDMEQQIQSWLNTIRRRAGETNMDYAIRLYQQPHEYVTMQMIATQAGVEREALLNQLGERWSVKLQKDQEIRWLSQYPRLAGEKNVEYALRLLGLRDEQVKSGTLRKKLIRNNHIALHASITPGSLASSRSTAKTERQWCNNHPRLPDETLHDGDKSAVIMEKNKQYALRLVKSRNINKTLRLQLSYIAAHVGITDIQLKLYINQARQQWFNRFPRLSHELSFENTNERAIQHNNQRYARRLTRQRDDEQMAWLITDNNLAQFAEITMDSYRQALHPLFEQHYSDADMFTEEEAVWQPDRGLLHLQLKQNPPLLADPKNPQRSITREVITGPVTLSNIKQVLKDIPKAQREDVAARFLEKAQELVESDGGRQDYFYDARGEKQPGLLSQKLQIYHNEQDPQLGLQIIAKEDIEAYELLGVYTGCWHPDSASLREECRKMGSQAVHTYLWGVYSGDASVSAWQNANKLALINTAQLIEDSPAEAKQYNNLGVIYINGELPAYYTTRKINKGDALLISYGNYYLADYMIQAAIQNDAVRIVAQKKQCWFVVKGMGEKNVAVFGPDGPATALPENAKPYILKERLDKRGILRYDAIYKKSERRIVVSPDNENNLYHAMAKAMYPRGGSDIIREQISEMKKMVKQEYAAEEGDIKFEPEETSADV